MEKKTYKTIDLDVYEETLDCGLKVFVCPMDRHDALAKITTHYGSGIISFKPHLKDEFTEIPLGTAHFLEHKMFAKEDGSDIMSIFQLNGANSNAYTSNHVTSYYFESPSKFFDNLKVLLDLVTKPYYTDENVEKEMGIIDQEIKAGFDDPYEAAYHSTMFNTFKNLPYRYPVAGYTDSIKDITPNVLYDCYNTFYHPSNISLTITGNVKPDETIKFIKEYYDKLDYSNRPNIQIREYDEPLEVFKEEEVIYKDVTNNIIENAYKVSFKNSDMDLAKALAYVSIYLNIKFGGISKFNKEIYEDKNILRPVGFWKDLYDDYLLIDFSTEVIETRDIFERIYNNLNDKEFSKEDFDLFYKNALKEIITMADSVGAVNNVIDYQVRMYGKVLYDYYNIYKNLNYEECVKFIDSLDFSNNTRIIVTKKKD